MDSLRVSITPNHIAIGTSSHVLKCTTRSSINDRVRLDEKYELATILPGRIDASLVARRDSAGPDMTEDVLVEHLHPVVMSRR